MQHPLRFVLSLLAVVVVAGCASEEPTEQTDDSGVTSPEDAGQADGSDASESPDTGREDVAEADEDTAAPRDYTIATFIYREVEEGGVISTTGVGVNLVGATEISKIAANTRSEDLTEADTQMLLDDYLTKEVHTKMKNDSWECGSDERHSGARYEFKARLSSRSSAKAKISNISGCIGQDSTQPDAQRVQEIASKLEELRAKYFE